MENFKSPFSFWDSVALVTGVFALSVMTGWVLQYSVRSIEYGHPWNIFPIPGIIISYVIFNLFNTWFMRSILKMRNYRLLLMVGTKNRKNTSENPLQHGQPFFTMSERLFTRYMVLLIMLCFVLPLWWETELSSDSLRVLAPASLIAFLFILSYYRNTSESVLYRKSANPILGF